MLATIFLAFTGSGLINLLIWLIVISLVFYLLWWLVGYIALPAPFDKVIRVLLALAAVIFLIYLLMGIAGSQTDFHHELR